MAIRKVNTSTQCFESRSALYSSPRHEDCYHQLCYKLTKYWLTWFVRYLYKLISSWWGPYPPLFYLRWLVNQHLVHERELLSLPARLGELGVFVPIVHFSSLFSSSSHITAPLIDHLLRGCTSCSLDIYKQMFQCKHELKASRQVCCDVGVEPALQPLDCEPLRYATANSEDGACLSIFAREFWGQNRQCAFFDVRVFNPFACSYSLSRWYCVHKQEKCRAYDEQIWGVKRACFSPVFFAAIGGMGPTTTTVYRMLVKKWNISYSRCLFWVRCRLCFLLLRSGVMCLRGQRVILCQLMLIWLILRFALILGPSSELFQMLMSSSCPTLNS